MEKLDAYKIDLKGMLDDVVTRQMVADDDFFAAVEGREIQCGNVALTLQVCHKAGAFEATLQFEGEVQVLCDRCLEPMMQPVEGEAEWKIKFGEEDEDDGDVIVVAEDKGILDLSWQVYEQIALQIPLSHVHDEGECNDEMQSVLSKHETHDADDDTQQGDDSETERATDPRWDALKKLISTNN